MLAGILMRICFQARNSNPGIRYLHSIHRSGWIRHCKILDPATRLTLSRLQPGIQDHRYTHNPPTRCIRILVPARHLQCQHPPSYQITFGNTRPQSRNLQNRGTDRPPDMVGAQSLIHYHPILGKVLPTGARRRIQDRRSCVYLTNWPRGSGERR